MTSQHPEPGAEGGSTPDSTSGGPLLNLRTATILLLGALAGIGAGVLAGLGGTAPSLAIVAGCAAFGGSVLFFNTIIN